MPEPTMRDRARRIVESGWFQNGVIALILINAVSLGLETYEELFAAAPEVFSVTETVFVGLFAAELALKVFAYGRSFFRDPWNWFDAIVVGIALVPSSSGFSVLRLLRILRILRLVSAVPQMRQIIGALFRSVPGMSTVIGLLLITVYTAAVLAEKLFEDVSPHYFGDLHTSLYTMFMVLTTENWPDIAESVTEQRPWAAAFFVGYIVVTAFILLNLVIGVIVTALEEEVESQRWKEDQELEQVQHDLVMARLEALSEQVERLSRQVAGLGGEGAGGGDRADGGPAPGK
ncbi:ion transporter [Nocardiopsis composta]|uniref:Voltage-gated sodium channel n=1 Tax=Nocardiopsis composta TaxID=157465 RepID=A0A7W8QPW2_9ACTN|nr:ion transporter [Nocardiopsis composta]MBB5434443.1 voltage-gated sodium channel [Nocardiopsis composta]